MYTKDGAGIVKSRPAFAPGLDVHGKHIDGAEARRIAWEQMPLFSDSAKQVIARIQVEDRQDYVVKAADLRMKADGTMTWPLKDSKVPALYLERRGLYLLLARLSGGVFSSSFQTLWRASASARAMIFNDLMAGRASAFYPDKSLKLRTRITGNDGAERTIYAVVSSRYPSVYDADHYLADVRARIKRASPVARGRVIYDPATTRLRFEAVWNAYGAEQDTGMRLSLNGATHDDASGRYRLWAGAVTGSGTYFPVVARDALLSRVHRGKGQTVKDQIDEAVTAGIEAIKPFLQRWSLWLGAPVGRVLLYGEQWDTVPEALGALVSSGRFRVGGSAEDAMLTLLAAWGLHAADESVAALLGTLAGGIGTVTDAEASAQMEDDLFAFMGEISSGMDAKVAAK